MNLTWITVTRAAVGMRKSKRQTMRRLHALNRQSGGRLLRPVDFRADGTPSKFEVCAEVLMEFESGRLAAAEDDLELINSRVDDLEMRLAAVRNSHLAHRRKTGRELEAINKRMAAHFAILRGFAELEGLDISGHVETRIRKSS